MPIKSSDEWLQRHVRDKFVQQSKKDGYPSRAAYKLLQLHKKKRLFKPGMAVLDLGAAPGGWSVVVSEIVGKRGRIVGVDLLPMNSYPRVEFLECDCYDPVLGEKLLALVPEKFDAVLSDMAPNMTGQRCVDQPRSMALVEHAFELACEHLNQGGFFLVKVFQGQGIDLYRQSLRKAFKKVEMHKPDASRQDSREQYILATGFLGYNV